MQRILITDMSFSRGLWHPWCVAKCEIVAGLMGLFATLGQVPLHLSAECEASQLGTHCKKHYLITLIHIPASCMEEKDST